MGGVAVPKAAGTVACDVHDDQHDTDSVLLDIKPDITDLYSIKMEHEDDTDVHSDAWNDSDPLRLDAEDNFTQNKNIHTNATGCNVLSPINDANPIINDNSKKDKVTISQMEYSRLLRNEIALRKAKAMALSQTEQVKHLQNKLHYYKARLEQLNMEEKGRFESPKRKNTNR